ncbi:alpha/beta hydrolase [Luedemannella flava]|uniref:Alpha/beta hydrolase n=1 Tax=Luedemannella flava TaxID=349316 RepID=A0ABN2LKS7_9ACTN
MAALVPKRRRLSAEDTHLSGRLATLSLADGGYLSVERQGPADAPMVIVLLHGWTLDKRVWRPQIEALTGQGHRIVAYDLRGHGRSSDVRPGQATVEQLADDLAEVLGTELAAGQRAVLVGHSLGGMAILELAQRHPDALSASVAGAVLVATSAEGSTHTDYGFASQALVAAARRMELAGAALLARSGTWRPHRALSPGLLPFLRWLLFGATAHRADVRLTLSTLSHTPLSSIGGFRPAVHLHRCLETLPALRGLPTSVLVGTMDRLTPPRCAEAIVEALPDAELTVLPDAGHMLSLERPAEVTEAIGRVVTAATTGRRPPTPRAGAVDTAAPLV